MSEETQRGSRQQLAQWFRETSLEDWDSLLRHFELGSGFALILLSVNNAEAARRCRDALREALDPLELLEIDATTPDALYALPSRLVTESLPEGTGAVWVRAGWDPEDPTRLAVQAAWEDAARRLNQHRDTLRQQLSVPLLLVGAAELPVLLREQAPDLWSVRTLQIQMEALDHLEPGRWIQNVPAFNFLHGQDAVATKYRQLAKLVAQAPLSPSDLASLPLWPAGWQGRGEEDPVSLLSEAALLRGQPGAAEQLSQILLRAAYGFARRHIAADLSHCLDELATLPEPSATRVPEQKLLRAFLALLQRDATAAVALVDPMAFSVEPPVEIRSVACELACHASLFRGDSAQAGVRLELLQGLTEPKQASAQARWRREFVDGISLNELERFAEAERAARRALVWAEQVSKETLFGRRSRRTVLCAYSRQQLAFVLLKQHRWPAAEEHARQAIAELECAGVSTMLQAGAWLCLATALEEQRRLTEAVEVLQYALQTLRAEEPEDPEDAGLADLRSTHRRLLNKLKKQQAAEGKAD